MEQDEPAMSHGEEARFRPTPPVDVRAVVEVDLDALRANWAKLNAAIGPDVTCAGVVKADAYGLGLERVTQALSAEGCSTFFVATVAEGRRVRDTQPGADVYVLDGLLPQAGEHYIGYNLRPVLSSVDEVQEWAAFSAGRGRPFPAAIQVETGMNRLGLTIDQLAGLIAHPSAPLKAFSVSLLMSHLACADEADHALNARQLAAFHDAIQLLPGIPASLANSGGVFLGPKYHFDLVRPGISLYGGRAFVGAPNPMQPVVRLRAKILQVRDVNANEAIGYGASYVVDRPMRIATIASGYADGFLRALSAGTGDVAVIGHIGAHQVHLVGRVSMDLITLDVSNVPPELVRRGGWVEILGARVTIDDLTDRAGTIGYELLTRLGNRMHRLYHEQGMVS